MPLMFSSALQTQMAQDIINLAGTTPTLNLYQGTLPQYCETLSTDPIIAKFNLPNPYLIAANGSDTLTGIWTTNCILAGTANYFRLLNTGVCILQGIVGYSYQNLWNPTTFFAAGITVYCGGNAYINNTTGTSGTVGPTGTTNGIVDGTCNWNYVGVVGDLNFVNPVFSLNQSITINNFQININNGS